MDFGFYNMDCLEGMRQFDDNYFDLAVVDPPYGIGYDTIAEKEGGTKYGNACVNRKVYHTSNWDDERPSKEYFDELIRVSKKQIIWGGNYFADLIPPSKSFIVWDKKTKDSLSNDFADCEYAWMSSNMGVARVFRFMWSGMLQQDMKNKEYRFHPTQKPVALYEWILDKYAERDYKILDTHCGSASSLVACERNGYKNYVGFEIDEFYYKKAKERLEAEKSQQNIFDYF